MVIGLERGIVRLEPYTPQWETLYREEEQRLRALVGRHVIDIQHVGSTAIPGICAKPIIDIGIAVARFEDGERCIAPIESLGYEYHGENGIPGRHYFVKRDPRTTHHIHMLEQDSVEWNKQIVFRDFLRANAEVAQEYAELKSTLATEYRNDRAAYTEGKTEFVERVLERAARERGIAYRTSPPLTNDELNALFAASWPDHVRRDFGPVLDRSLAYLCAYRGSRLVGFVYLAWDGDVHAFLLDPTVHPDERKQGIGTQLVRRAAAVARERGVEWLHVDFEPHLLEFYRGCGFRHTEAGLINLPMDETCLP